MYHQILRRSLRNSTHQEQRLFTARRQPLPSSTQRCYMSPTAACSFPMKPGTVIQGLGFRKDREPPVVREEYPEWVKEMAEPMSTLAKLRRMPEEEATDRDKKRYLKLTRRMVIRQKNEESSKK